MKHPMLVGVAGGSGSGKTTICDAVCRELVDCQVISTDNYYHSLDHMSPPQRTAVNFDHPEALDVDLLASHLRWLKQGVTIDTPSYCFQQHVRMESSIRMGPSGWILVEGILTLALPAVRALMDLCIFVDAAEPTRLQRRLARDVRHRGRAQESVVEQWQSSVQVMYQEFVEPSRRYAELVISTESSASDDVLQEVLRSMQRLKQ